MAFEHVSGNDLRKDLKKQNGGENSKRHEYLLYSPCGNHGHSSRVQSSLEWWL
ncbi:hypothetical protein SESBI_41850 [Sesbania bispinosa]|nr:hypothetical protein SESBI_41850 [Sesbania bispinosa]